MPVEDKPLDPGDKAYRPAKTEVLIVHRQVRIGYKKSYGGMSPYIKGIMGGGDARLLYTVCENAGGHDRGGILRFQVPRADCPECYGRTRWEQLPDGARFYVNTLSTAVELAGISFMDQLPVTVAWISAVLPGPEGAELDTLTAGMVRVEDYTRLKKGDELRPVFRHSPRASASDAMWVLKGTPKEGWPEGYVQSKNYRV
ncbi:MAG: hypothetical protein HY579_11130 [Nitrospinae bacterium]|nr:hypothetical protein [Nitrospinota bacterium]